MLTQLEVFTPGITVPPWPIVDQNVKKDPIQIKRIDGIGPVTANVNTTGYGSIDGEFETGAFVPKRNIVLTVGLNPDWGTQTIESLRQVIYSYFMPKNKVRLQFSSTHMAQVTISGTVESCDPNIFSQDPEYQISIICSQPYFVATAATVVTGTVSAIDTPVIELIEYEGSVDTGFVVNIALNEFFSDYNGEIRVSNDTPSLKIISVTDVDITSSAYFSMGSVQGDKFVRSYPLPSGTPTSLLGKLVTGSEWLSLRKGINQVKIMAEDGSSLHWSLSYYARYGGL